VTASTTPSVRLRRSVAAELGKLATVWSTPVLGAIAVTLALLIGLVVAFASGNGTTALAPIGTAGWYDNVFSAMGIAQYLAVVFGVILVTNEYRHKTVTAVYLMEPRRPMVVASKVVAGGAIAAVLVVVVGFADLIMGEILVATGHGSGSMMLGQFGDVFSGVLCTVVLLALVAVGAGTLLRNQVVALTVTFGVLLVVDGIVDAYVPSVGRWLPTAAAQAVENMNVSVNANVGANLHVVSLLSPGVAAAVLVGYGAVFTVLGALTTLWADVT
jgi:ABC-2 type transport system permease protein